VVVFLIAGDRRPVSVKLLRVAMSMIALLTVFGPAMNIARSVMDLWSGLPGPEYHEARVLIGVL
jgi:hypothetical protein